ncbi:outer membrane protein assembly factor BamD [Rhizobium sp. L1K21]|nr:outer membrane protein assembly factor BamD [Rhizobium sp. L1K21]MCO6185653.1 outer membrane protein assembly factor BamD [Rhizobium sp. L1K21]
MGNGVRSICVAIVLGLMGLTLAACNSDPDLDITKLGLDTDPPDTLYNQGLANLNAGKLGEADAKFQAIDKYHPFSEYSRKGLVMSAFVRYRMGRYDDAISASKRYMSLYPQAEDADYALYLQGLSYYKKIPDVTQDQAYSGETIRAMSELIKDYPDSEYVPDAREKMRAARDQLAGKEMQVGRYYQERKEYLAAIARYRNVVEHYQQTNQIEEALARLVESYYALGLNSEAQTAAAVLGANYPDSQWYADSYKLLQSGGLEPRENRGSWISRVAKQLVLGEKTP